MSFRDLLSKDADYERRSSAVLCGGDAVRIGLGY